MTLGKQSKLDFLSKPQPWNEAGYNASQPEFSLVVGDPFWSAILGRALQDHNVDGPGGVAPAGPDPTLPVPRRARLDVGDGQRTGGEEKGSHLYQCYLRTRLRL